MNRVWQHALVGRWHIRQLLNAESRNRITECVAEAERGHLGQIRVVIEATPGMRHVRAGRTARERALEVFAQERVWDTHHNNGVLLYLLVAERDAEVVADRGLNALVPHERWEEICQLLEREVSQHGFVHAVCDAVRAIGDVLRSAFPADTQVNELPDDVVVR
jgi:uncharacterized membrane protein